MCVFHIEVEAASHQQQSCLRLAVNVKSKGNIWKNRSSKELSYKGFMLLKVIESNIL